MGVGVEDEVLSPPPLDVLVGGAVDVDVVSVVVVVVVSVVGVDVVDVVVGIFVTVLT